MHKIQGQNALRFYKEVAYDDEFNGFVLDNQEPLLWQDGAF